MKVDLSRYSDEWKLSEDGIWRSAELESVSYPSDGNELYFQIEETSFWFRHRNEVIRRLLAMFEPQGVFFDVGGGNGFVGKSIQDTGRPLVLVEPGDRGVANARQRGVQNIVQSMWNLDVVKSGSVAAVGLFDVVEHLEDDFGFLRIVRETLAPNGLLFMTIPAFDWLWSSDDVEAGHFRRYQRGSMIRLLEKANFRVEYSSYFFCLLPPPIFALRTLPSLLGLRKKTNAATIKNEHCSKVDIVSKLHQSILDWELVKIARQKSLPWGSSCVVVARKATPS